MRDVIPSSFRNIVICGDVGTGKTTLSKNLAEKLSWRHMSAGDFFREYVKKQNTPLWDKSAIPDDVERKVDQELLDKTKNDEHIVFDTHYGGWFARNLDDVFRILLVCDEGVATKRTLEREHTHEETSEELEKRRRGLREKFKKLYGDDDYKDPKYFHLVFDTTKAEEGKTLKIALDRFQRELS
ncbi:nucleoside monophosphate kinase [Patescibacteria group bacterium]|nr:nucleoside monophosphate kinase [Patescibacteria group bacterium]